MKKIYMAGAGGMLGEAFYYTFKNNYKITCSDKDVNEQWLNYLNFTNHDKYMSEVSKFSPDYLFHLGAITDLEYCEKNKEEAIQSNLEAVKHAVNISNQLNIKLLFISTAGIFDGRKDIYDEDDSPNPLCVYAHTKYEAEKYVKKNSNNFLICRPGWMMGGGLKKDKKFIAKVIKQLLNGNKEIFIVDDKMGTPTYTYDFAKNVEILIKNQIQGLYNIVCDGLTSRYEVSFELLKNLNLDKKININKVSSDYFKNEYFAKRPQSERLINKNLNDLNLNFMRDWKICLKEYIENEFNRINL